MAYFVAEDVVHLRLQDRLGYVSACGYEYAPIAVDWAGDYEPEAWPACEECLGAGSAPVSETEDLVVTGVYALEDDAHLLVGRAGGMWRSACGRTDPNDAVNWAGHEWPDAYEECPACAAMVDASLWTSVGPDEADSVVLGPTQSLSERVRGYRLWVVSSDGVEHRPADQTLTTAMCGAELQPENAQRTAPIGGPGHCHECDRAVGAARAALRPGRPVAKPKRTPARPSKRVEKHAQPTTKRRRRSRAGTDKEIALFGRKMIVPVRFVRGGLPGLGKRH